MKKHITSLILTLALIAALIVPASAATETGFNDVPADAWFAPYVEYAVSHGLFYGVGGGKFAPGATMNRAMFVTVLSRVAKADTAAAPEAELQDVPAGQYFTGAVNWAVSNNYIALKGEDSFSPYEPVTRQVVADAMYRYLTSMGINLEDPTAVVAPFKDMDQVADWAVDAVKFVWQKGIMNGNDDGTFAPEGQLTRAQAAAVFQRLDQRLAEFSALPEDPDAQEDPADPEPAGDPDTTEELGDELPFPDYPYLVDDAYIAEFSAEMLRLCNEARAAESVAPLQYMADVQHIVNARAAELTIRNSHTRPNGGAPDTIFGEYGYRLRGSGGENISARGTVNIADSGAYTSRSALGNAEACFNAWMSSSGHRKNIMNPNFSYMGVGLAYSDPDSSGTGRLFAAQLFTGSYSPVS